MENLTVGVFYRDALRPGGVPTQTLQLCSALNEIVNHVVLHAYMDSEETFDPSRFTFRVNPHIHRGVTGISDPWRLPSSLRDSICHNADNLDVLLLIGSFIPENAPVGRVAVASGLPYVVSVQDAFTPVLWSGRRGVKKSLYHLAVEKRLIEKAAGLRIYSDEVRHHLSLRGHRCNGRCFVAKEGIDLDKDESKKPHRLSTLKGSAPRFGFLGRLDIFQKGLDILVQAWRRHVASGGRGSLDLVGPASVAETRMLRRLIGSGVDRLNVRGPLYGSEKFKYLRSLDYFVHPSRHEGIPRAVLEALGVGIPVIITPGTNLHDIVAQDCVGYVVDLHPKSIETVFKQADKDQWDDTAQLARFERARSDLSWRSVAEDLAQGLTGSVRLSGR